MSQLRQLQSDFVLKVASLINYAYESNYEFTFGEAYRPVEMAEIYARRGIGISNSLHRLRLAIDLNLFRDGVYLTRTEDHQRLGEYWESIGGTWGGRFGDGNHYSLEYNGVK